MRKTLRLARRSFRAAEHARRSRIAAARISRLPAFRAGARIALYLPFDGEVNPGALLAAAERRGIRVYVPVVVDRAHRRMRFQPLGARTRRGAFGILIPHRTPHGKAVGPRWLDLIVVPLVAVDGTGRRLGMGGGFYDRALAFRPQRTRWPGPKLVGLAFDCQRVETVFAEPFDVRLDALATESGLLHFSRDTP